MKIRQSFVTNSSSSSFIIATKKDITEEEIKESCNKEYFKQFIYDYDLQDEDIDNNFNQACHELYLAVSNYSNLHLDDWIVYQTGEIYSEGLNEYSFDNALIYYGCIGESDRIKVRSAN